MTDRVSETCSTFSRLEATLPLTDNRQFSFMSKCIYVFGHKWSNPLQKERKHNQLGNTQPDNYQFTFPNRRLVASSNFSATSSKTKLAQRAWCGLQLLSNNSSNLLSSLGDYYQHLSMLPF